MVGDRVFGPPFRFGGGTPPGVWGGGRAGFPPGECGFGGAFRPPRLRWGVPNRGEAGGGPAPGRRGGPGWRPRAPSARGGKGGRWRAAADKPGRGRGKGVLAPREKSGPGFGARGGGQRGSPGGFWQGDLGRPRPGEGKKAAKRGESVRGLGGLGTFGETVSGVPGLGGALRERAKPSRGLRPGAVGEHPAAEGRPGPRRGLTTCQN